MRYREVIGERRLNELLRPSDKEAAGAILQNAGYSKVGSGVFADVWSKPGSEFVLKLFDKADQSYLRFIDLVKNNPSPYFPTFKGKPIEVNDEYVAIRIEKLDGFVTPAFAEKVQRYVSNRRSFVSDENLKRGLPEVFNSIVELDRQWPGFKAALDLLADEYGSGRRSFIDLHNENIMLRNGAPVIIDPAS
jgi:hypothetical protein